jgi:hypothetical protein
MRPAFATLPSTFAGHVVHFTEHYEFSSPSSGSQNETDDLWLQLGADGHVTTVHTVTRDANGKPVGEQLLTQSGGTRLNAPGNMPGLPATAPCQSSVQFMTPNSLDGFIPKFFNIQLFAASQAVPAGPQRPPSQQPPATAVVSGATPLASYGPATSVTPWVRTWQPATGVQEVGTTELGPDGRVVYTDERTTDTAGGLIRDISYAYGRIDVYDNGAVPASTFTLSSEVCGG